ncbi:MAG: thrombospondin type 3 repeat-containing protein [archaeon]
MKNRFFNCVSYVILIIVVCCLISGCGKAKEKKVEDIDFDSLPSIGDQGNDNCPNIPNGPNKGTCLIGGRGVPVPNQPTQSIEQIEVGITSIDGRWVHICKKNSDCIKPDDTEGYCSLNFEDADYDKIGDACDNCIVYYNPEQEDSNNDRIGNICQDDFDGDKGQNNPMNSDSDKVDNCPTVPNGPDFGVCMERGANKLAPGKNGEGANVDDNKPYERTSGLIKIYGITYFMCISDNDCAEGAYCSMNYEDSDGDGIGDACDGPAPINAEQLCGNGKLDSDFTCGTESGAVSECGGSDFVRAGACKLGDGEGICYKCPSSCPSDFTCGTESGAVSECGGNDFVRAGVCKLGDGQGICYLCRSNSQIMFPCGNGILDSGEECDFALQIKDYASQIGGRDSCKKSQADTVTAWYQCNSDCKYERATDKMIPGDDTKYPVCSTPTCLTTDVQKACLGGYEGSLCEIQDIQGICNYNCECIVDTNYCNCNGDTGTCQVCQDQDNSVCQGVDLSYYPPDMYDLLPCAKHDFGFGVGKDKNGKCLVERPPTGKCPENTVAYGVGEYYIEEDVDNPHFVAFEEGGKINGYLLNLCCGDEDYLPEIDRCSSKEFFGYPAGKDMNGNDLIEVNPSVGCEKGKAAYGVGGYVYKGDDSLNLPPDSYPVQDESGNYILKLCCGDMSKTPVATTSSSILRE